MDVDWSPMALSSGCSDVVGHLNEASELSDVVNCFVCDTTSENPSTLVNIFHSDSAIRSQLKERLEGVLSVQLEEEQPAGPLICSGCMHTLVHIESLTAGFRNTFDTTRCNHCSRQNGFVPGITEMQESSNTTGLHSGTGQHVKSYLHNITSLSKETEYTVGKNTNQKTNLSQHSKVLIDTKEVPEKDIQSDADTEAEDKELFLPYTEDIRGDIKDIFLDTTEIPVVEKETLATKEEALLNEGEKESPSEEKETDSLELDAEKDKAYLIKQKDQESDLKMTKRKRKSTKPQRVLKEESDLPLEEKDHTSEYNADTDDAADQDAIPDNESLEPNVQKRKRGRPKGSKNKVKSVHLKESLGTEVKKPRLPKQQGGTCEICNKVFLCNYKLNRHRLTHSEERPYKCTKCDHQFKAKYHLDRHLQIHSGVRPHVCTNCGISFREKHQLAEHQLQHTGELPHACMECGQRFQKASALKQHMYDHTGNWPFKCNVCDLGFLREAELREHATMHTGEKPFKCDQCGDAFRLANTLKVHMRRHTGIKPYVCKLCDSRFAAANTLKEHLRTHSGERKFLCDTCGAAFVHQSGLVQHSKTHLAVADRKHVCPYCQRRFNELSLLKRHQRIHTGERPYMCSKCGKAFRRPGELSMHYRYHSNDRRHVCTTCNKSFFTKSHLKRHQATHSSSGLGGNLAEFQSKSNVLTLQPFNHHDQPSSIRYHNDPNLNADTMHACMICSKQFRHLDLLTKHISRVHAQGVSMEEQMSSIAAIEEYTNPYNPEELGLPYMHPMHIIPQ